MHRPSVLILFALLFITSLAAAQTLDRVRDSGELRLGYRQDAPPFSYENTLGEPAGYAVDLCRHVASAAKSELRLDRIEVIYVPVTAENRFAAVQEGKIDVLCGPTSVTLSRRELVDFSLFTFIDGAGVLFRSDGPSALEDLAGLKVGVRGGTTTETALVNTLEDRSIDASVVVVTDHSDGLKKLDEGVISAYFADQAILLYLAAGSADPQQLRLSKRHFTHEPYALAMRRGDGDFRLLVDRTLSRLYRSGDIAQVFRNAFGANADPSDAVLMLYSFHGLQE